MKTFIALLRGINVGGHNILPMKALRQVLTDSGLFNVKTYIQSGNVVFQSDMTSQLVLSERIQAAIESRHGFSPQVHLLTVDELRSAIANNPFAAQADDPKTTHLYFLASLPECGGVERAEALAKESETCELVANVFYLHAPDGVGRSKIAAGVEKALGVSATARNLRSATRVLELAAAKAE